jgi:glycosyltransferase involved in cell wall biosynthesis
MRDVVRERPECQLVIGGSGPMRAGLEEQARLLGLEQNVRFAGFIPEGELADYYGVADLFLLPTRVLEGFGLVTIEAMASGTPVLGTPVGGTQEILRRFDPSFLFPGLEPRDLARGILDRLPEIEGSQALRDRCRNFVLDTYAWDVLIPQVEELMERIVVKRRQS